MNTFIMVVLAVGYAAIMLYIYSDYRKVCKTHNVTRNRNKWIVRNKKGRFVKLPRNTIQGFFTVCMHAYEEKE